MRKTNIFFQDPISIISSLFLLSLIVLGIFAPSIAPHNPNFVDLPQKLQAPSKEFLLGTDQLGRCILSRIIFGIRTTFFYASVAMVCTIFLGIVFGMIAGYSKGFVGELIMRICDGFLSFPSEVLILAILGILGPGILNIIVANILSKWAWYTRMISSTVQQYQNKNYVKYAQVTSNSRYYVLRKHVFSGISSEVIIHASLEMGWVILSISSLSFLGLGVQPPTAEWGMMLNEAKNVMFTHPWQMIPSGLTILLVICMLNFFGDSLQQAFNVQHAAPRKKIKRRKDRRYAVIKR